MTESVKSLREVVSMLQKNDEKVTLLGIGPMSEVVIRATLELGKDMKFPVMLIASRNQVDSAELGGGYVMGWDQKAFSDAVSRIAGQVGFDGPLYLCRDHGGPWQRDNERYGKIPGEEAMRRAKASYKADLEAGFTLIHIDPTKDPHYPGTLPMNTVIARTIELMEYTEEQANLSAVSYEVGTEETTGGLISSDAFERFIASLLKELDKRRMPHPAFIVGQTGTLVKMNKNVGHFDAENTRKLCQIARQYGLGFKEHNADYLPLNILRIHPEIGITGANIAPEFGLVETMELLKLTCLEEAAIKGRGDLKPSGFGKLIRQAALESGRWKKWLFAEDTHLTGEDIAQNPEKLEEVTMVCGHYVFNQKNIRDARSMLYNNLIALKITDSPEKRLVEGVKDAIMRYVNAFKLLKKV